MGGLDAGPGGGRDAGPLDSGSVEPDAGPRSCTGCVDTESGACLRGTSNSACGGAGAACDVCTDAETCEARVCVARQSCGSADCDGCCMGQTCLTSAQGASACGEGGASCMACGVDEACVDGMCEPVAACGASSCSDGCCDDAGGCQPGTALTACGANGATCAACPDGWTCDSGVCTAPCALRCDGCCDGETCRGGSSRTSCGVAGAACENCGSGGTCTAGACVDTACADDCEGCCDGELCRGGNLAGACGSGGAACVDCGPSFTCGGASTCEVDEASRWDLFIESASYPGRTPGGAPWDPFNGLPDAYAIAESNDPSGGEHSGQTSTINNTLSPEWDDRVLDDVPARDLRDGVLIRVRDDDGVGDDDIGRCSWTPSNNAFSWGRLTLTCPARASGPATVETRVTVRLVRL